MAIENSRQKAFVAGARRGAAALALLLVPGWALAQNVLWEDYRGLDSVASDADYIGPAGKPKFTNNPNNVAMAPFRALAANPANAARTGSSANIDFRSDPTSQTALCNIASANSQACLYQAQGRVLYALIVFPQAGSYTLSAAHDDNLVVELSSDYANTNYRSASYGIPVGSLAEWTSNDTTFETVGTFSAANAGSCALIRAYWTNQNGVNHNRLRWTRPGGTTEIVPASAFRNPSLAASATGCNGSVTGNGTAITLNKVLGSQRLAASDQFTIEIGTSAAAGTVRSATTSGAGTGQQASTGAYPAATGTPYFVREVMAPGSASALTAYTATIACTRNGVAFTPQQEGSPANRRWRVTPSANDQIVCSITNTAPTADLSIAKTNNASSVTRGGTTTYTITATNNGPASVTGAVVADAPVAGLSCPATNPVTCSDGAASACPTGALTVANLLSGITLGTLPATAGSNTVTFSFTCDVP